MIYIMCPAMSYTGGPTLAHQLCSILNKNNINAAMWYYGRAAKSKNPVHEMYRQFENPYVTSKPNDTEANTIVALESKTTVLAQFHRAHRVIWWMSVDNFYLNMGSFFDIIRKRFFGFRPTIEYCKRYEGESRYKVYKEDDILHLVQSEYARLFLLEKGVPQDSIKHLGDYIENEIIEASKCSRFEEKEDIVLYNPKKGIEFTERLMKSSSDIKWVPLINMSKNQLIDAMQRAKVYIDFGNHPGKDRIPREAVLCGCCIITGKRGSAKNNVDIPIPECYKFDDCENNVERIVSAIRELLSTYSTAIHDFDNYRDRILREEDEFETEAIEIFADI